MAFRPMLTLERSVFAMCRNPQRLHPIGLRFEPIAPGFPSAAQALDFSLGDCDQFGLVMGERSRLLRAAPPLSASEFGHHPDDLAARIRRQSFDWKTAR